MYSKVSERKERKKERSKILQSQIAASAVKMEFMPQMFLFINFQLREMHG